MNKALLAVCVVLLGISAANTALLVHMGGKVKEAADKTAALAKELETKVQPMLQALAEKGAPPGKPPAGPGELKGKPAEATGDGPPDLKVPAKTDGPPDGKAPAKPGGPPFLPGPPPNK